MKKYSDYVNEIHTLETRKDFVKYVKTLNDSYNDIDNCEFALLKFELFHCFKNKGYKESKSFNYGIVVLRIPEEKI